MEDVLFYENYQVAGDTIAIVICIAIFFLLNSAYAVKRKNLSVFKAVIFLCLVASYASMGYHMMVQNVTSKNVLPIYICRAACYICLIWVYVCFFIYVRNLVGMRASFAKVFRFSIIGVAFDKIAVELTESRNKKDFNRVKRVMKELQGRGIKFYLDDFGTGYSNFERIIGLPIDIIKFDRSLTIMAGLNETSKFMVGSFSEIFKKADYQILFEGVEDEKDETQCIDMDAMYLQGYKYSKPIPIEQLEEFLEKVA